MISRRNFMGSVSAGALCSAVTFPAGAAGTVVSTAAPKNAIALNQIGYLPNATKYAVLQGNADVAEALVTDAASGRTVGAVSPETRSRDRDSGFRVQRLDFSKITTPGRYRLLAGELASPVFEIGASVYDRLLRSLLRSFYLQRCGVALDDAETGLKHAACHVLDGKVWRADVIHDAGHVIEAPGGWHDAGDFGKYIATTTVAVGRILSAYERSPDVLGKIDLNIPEAGKSEEPDVLLEMRVGINWMRAMQRSDGAVYRKLSGAKWPNAIAPDHDTQSRYLFGIGTPDTAKFAATMAIAARIYEEFDKPYATRCLDAARRAWAFLEPYRRQYIDWRKEDDSGSGPYVANDFDREISLREDVDDRAWAGTELFLTTGDREFLDPVKTYVEWGEFGLNEWKNPAPLGLENLLLRASDLPDELGQDIANLLRNRAARLTATVRRSGYGLSNTRFIWGSNKMVAENGCAFAVAHQISRNASDRDIAQRQADFLLGTNPLTKCFVTGAGSNPVRKVAHLYARAVGLDIPGLLVGGPNTDAQDKIAPGGLGVFSYLDHEKSYSTNEYAIDYNASLIALLTALIDIHQ